MTKEQLLGHICLADAINECCSENVNSDTSCEKCELELSILLDKFAKQIKEDAIEEAEEDAENRFNRILDDEKRLSYEQGRTDAITEREDFWEMQNNFAYEQGRADKYREITSEYMLLTEKQVAEIIADAIEEYHLKLLNCKADKVKSIHDAEIWVEFKRQSTRIAEQLKEQNSIIDSLKPKSCNEMPRDIVCNCTKDHKIYYRETEDEYEELDIDEHDKYIRAEVIEEVKQKLNRTGVKISFNFPVEEIDLDNLAMLIQDVIREYIGVLDELKEQK